jgi:hypothetical protein
MRGNRRIGSQYGIGPATFVVSAASVDRADTSSPPIWRLLVGPIDRQGERVYPIRLEEKSAPGVGRAEILSNATDQIPSGGVLLLTCERGNHRAILQLLSSGRWRRVRTQSLRRLARDLRDAELDIEARYAVWPSADCPRVVVSADSYAAVRWVQRSGVLGGGGEGLIARALARSRLFTPFAFLLAPAMAIVARKARPDGTAP